MLSLVNVNEAGQPIEGENVSRFYQDQTFESYLKSLYYRKMRIKAKQKLYNMPEIVVPYFE